jgi:hypothetical protein
MVVDGTNIRSLQVHDKTAHNKILRSTPTYQDEVFFRVSPESNPNIFDVAAIAIRSNTNENFEKIYSPQTDAFIMYSLAADNKKLMANAVPPGTNSVKLCLEPGAGGRLTIRASRLESIAKVWLEDLLTHTVIDLKQDDSYTFDTNSNDSPERFLVHFNNAPTGIDEVSENFLQGYYSNGELVIKGLLESDKGETIFVVDTQGRILTKAIVTQTPELHIPVSLVDGVYIAKLQGKRTVTVKFIKGGTL